MSDIASLLLGLDKITMDTKTLALFEEYALPLLDSDSRVLEVGSLDKNGSVSESVKKVVNQYIGIDMRAGKAVDRVMNAHDLLEFFPKRFFDMVICFNTLEHDDEFWVTLDNMYGVLDTSGYLVFSVPDIGFPTHSYPKDYFRFTETAVKEIILEDYEQIMYERFATKVDVNYTHFCMGRKL